jgi:hypothetical protein
VRFRPGNASTDTAWLGWLEETRRNDRLAVRRDEKTLDSLDGTVVAIGRETIQFDMGGNVIDAPIAKLEGVLLSATETESRSTGIRVNDTSGSQYVAESVELSEDADELMITLLDSIPHSIPLDQLLSIQYAGGVLRLSDAEIASSGFGLNEATNQNPELAKSMQAWFSPKSLSDQSIADVFAMSSPGETSFRIPTGYEKFVAAVRRKPEVHLMMPINVQVLVDGKEQWSAILKDRETLGLELPLNDSRLLTLKISATTSDQLDDGGPPSTSPASSGTSTSLGGSIEWFGGRLLK